MRKYPTLFIGLIVAVCLLSYYVVLGKERTLAVTSGQESESIPWQVISSGGKKGNDGVLHLSGTIGQTAVGVRVLDSNELWHGYWQVFEVDGDACCMPPTVGDVDQSGTVDITDISILIDNQFLTLTPLICEEEGNINYPGSGYETTDMVVDITDLSILIDNQFLTLTPLPPCP